ncbi:winged helix-turn-helix transcriptional regulator [Allorhizocola rhizosphaerae]|uniref:winged helix-turn-helix transcriptional regulator n=1 Tax=Allorhizocola rhizosphaerae TaxID=1872709 RepID=UPI000E3C22C5|nr:winged helix-turn-helix transcriptional regulator [Allorhizocola rhizosphaerae]
MPRIRRVADGCGIAHALHFVGERWALLIVRELLLGPKRFTDLQEGLPAAGPKVLAQRLRELEDAGVVRRRTLPPPASSHVYELTEWGARLETVVLELGRWGAASPAPLEGEVGPDSAMLRLRTCFAAKPARKWTATYEMRLGRNRFGVRVADGQLVEIFRGEPPRPDVVIDTDSTTLDHIIGGEQTLQKAVRDGRVTVTGEVRDLQRLLDATHP